jgi:tellurite methyltransferase
MLPEKAPEAVVLEAMALAPAQGDALDIACGTGRHSRALAAAGWRVTAIDNSAVALEILRNQPTEGIEIIQADLETAQLECERYDLICDTCFLHRPLFSQMRDALRPGGLFVGVFPLEGINPVYLARPGEILRFFEGWQTLAYAERPSGSGRMRAEIISRKVIE